MNVEKQVRIEIMQLMDRMKHYYNLPDITITQYTKIGVKGFGVELVCESPSLQKFGLFRDFKKIWLSIKIYLGSDLKFAESPSKDTSIRIRLCGTSDRNDGYIEGITLNNDLYPKLALV